MSESTLDAVVNATQTQTVDPDEVLDADEAQEVQEDEARDEAQEKQLAKLLRKAEAAYLKGNKGLLLSRVECGRYCHEIYILRQTEGHKDRGFTSQIIFNRLAVHADNRHDCDASNMAKLFKTVELLAEGDNWKALSLGKLQDLSVLVQRADGSELYAPFDKGKVEQCKALFTWSCGDGIKRPSRQDISERVMELTNPDKFAEKQAKQAEKAAAKQAGKDVPDTDDDEEETPTVENLIATDPGESRAKPNWKDVPDAMAAFYKEGIKQAPEQAATLRETFVEKMTDLTAKDAAGWMSAFFQNACKRHPGKGHEILLAFAQSIVWTTPTIKGLIAGIADGKDAALAERMLQVAVDCIADEYSIYPSDETADEESTVAAA